MLSAITFHDFLPFSLLVEKKIRWPFQRVFVHIVRRNKNVFSPPSSCKHSHIRQSTFVVSHWMQLLFVAGWMILMIILKDVSANGKIYALPFSSLVTVYKKTMAKNNIHLQDWWFVLERYRVKRESLPANSYPQAWIWTIFIKVITPINRSTYPSRTQNWLFSNEDDFSLGSWQTISWSNAYYHHLYY